MCGDARSRADVESLMAGAKARMAFADPPYNLKIAGFQGRGRTKHREFLVASGEQTREEFIGFLRETSANIAAVCVDGAIVFTCMAPHRRDAGRRGGGLWRAEEPHRLEQDLARARFVLPKPARADLRLESRRSATPECVRPRRPWAHARQCVDLPRHEQLQVRPPAGDLALHPTVKPVALVAYALRDCSMKVDTVVVLVMGSGTAIMA